MPEHPIRRYCRQQGISQSEFAREIGVSQPFVSQLVTGVRRCSGEVALAIHRATGGRIGLEELLSWGEEE